MCTSHKRKQNCWTIPGLFQSTLKIVWPSLTLVEGGGPSKQQQGAAKVTKSRTMYQLVTFSWGEETENNLILWKKCLGYCLVNGHCLTPILWEWERNNYRACSILAGFDRALLYFRIYSFFLFKYFALRFLLLFIQ